MLPKYQIEMTKYIKYLWYILRHKWFVFVECRRLEITWLGIIHDWSKFRLSEFIPYAKHFYSGNRIEKNERERVQGYDKSNDIDDDLFNRAWLLHLKRNKHHWQWWLLSEANRETKILSMYHKYRKEMLADWTGTGKAITGKNNNREWYNRNKDNILLSPRTRYWIERNL